MAELAQWLQRLGLEQYADLFAAQGVDLELLPTLTDQDLKDLGLPLGPRRAVLRALEATKRQPEIAARSAGETRPPEWRQLTIMFCDLANSTSLSSSLDPEDYRDLLAAYQQACSVAIRLYQGYIARCVGDGILAYFGYPIAHEGEADRAVRAGLAVVEAVIGLSSTVGKEKGVDLGVRVGIATGFVVVGDIVGEGVLDRDAVVGKTPNLAARLQGIAAPNTVTVSSATKKLAGSFNFVALGEHRFKGIDEPTAVWQVEGERVVSWLEARQAALTDYVNRDQEIDLLLECWRRSKSVEGQVVVLSGEPGIGKSRLAAEVCDRILAMEREAGAPPPNVLCFQCSRYHSNTILYPVIQQLKKLVSIDPREPEENKSAKLQVALRHWGIVSSDTISLLTDLCNIRLSGVQRASTNPTVRRHQTIAALIDWCQSLAQDQSLLLIFEDIQWTDPTSRLLLSHLVEWARTARALIIATARVDSRARTRRSIVALAEPSPHVTHCELGQLSEEQTKRLISAVAVGRDIPAAVVDALQQKSGRIPLFAEELTIGLLEADAFSKPATAGDLLVPVPNNINDALMARLDQMGKAKEIALQASVLGREFSTPLLAKITGTPDGDLHEFLDNLERSDIITAGSAHGTYLFRHSLTRDIAYQSLLRRTRQEIHLIIATELALHGAEYPETTDDLIAQHYSLGEAKEEAIRWWRRGAKRAIAASAHEEAANMLRRAFHDFKTLGNAGSPPLELDLTQALATALRSLDGYAAPEVEERLLRARELCANLEDKDNLFNVEWELFQCNIVKGNIHGAHGIASRLLEYAETRPSPFHVDAHLAEGMARFHFGDFIAACASFERGVELSNPETDEPRHFTHGQNPGCFCLSYLAHSQCFLGRLDEAKRAVERNLAIATRRSAEAGHVYTHVNVLTFAIRVHQFLGNANEVKRLAEELIDLSRRGHYRYYEALGTAHLGWAIAVVGSIHPGIAKMQEGLAALEKTRTLLALPGFYLLLAELSLKVSRVDEAQRALGEAVRGGQSGTRMWDAEAERIRGLILASGSDADLPASENAYRASLEISRHQHARSLELKAGVGYAALLMRLDRREEGRRVLEECLAHMPPGQAAKEASEARDMLKSL
jgi:class 3 adenylate cyclase/tetratricopeptide (TPR) repeat protein